MAMNAAEDFPEASEYAKMQAGIDMAQRKARAAYVPFEEANEFTRDFEGASLGLALAVIGSKMITVVQRCVENSVSSKKGIPPGVALVKVGDTPLAPAGAKRTLKEVQQLIQGAARPLQLTFKQTASSRKAIHEETEYQLDLARRRDEDRAFQVKKEKERLEENALAAKLAQKGHGFHRAIEDPRERIYGNEIELAIEAELRSAMKGIGGIVNLNRLSAAIVSARKEGVAERFTKEAHDEKN